MVDASQIKEHMEVIGADGVHVGTVDGVEGAEGSWRIKLTKADSSAGFAGEDHEGHHHFISMGLVAGIEGEQVRLSANADVAVMFEEEDDDSDDDDINDADDDDDMDDDDDDDTDDDDMDDGEDHASRNDQEEEKA